MPLPGDWAPEPVPLPLSVEGAVGEPGVLGPGTVGPVPPSVSASAVREAPARQPLSRKAVNVFSFMGFSRTVGLQELRPMAAGRVREE